MNKPEIICGAVLLALGVSSLPIRAAEPGEILLQAGDTAGVELVGKARLGPPKAKPEEVEAAGFAGKQVIHVGTSGKENPDEARVVFSPLVPKEGFYEVHVRWFSPRDVNYTTDELPLIIRVQGRPVTFRMSQKLGNAWVFLGTHRFAAGSGGQIIADATGTYGNSNIAAVKLVPAAQAPEPQRPRTVAPPDGPDDEYGRLRGRLAELLTPPLTVDYADPFIADRIGQSNADAYLFWKTMQKGSGVTELWNDPRVGRDIAKNEGGGWPLVEHFNRLQRMAAAYVSSAWPIGFGAKMQGNPELRADILYGLEFLYQNRFNERTKNKLGAEWISNEMLQPKAILETILLLHPQVPQDFVAKQIATIDRMNPDPFSCYGGGGVTAGSNRFGFVYNHVLRGVVEKDPRRIEMATGAVWDQLEFNNRAAPIKVRGKPVADGFYEDGSFIYHQNLPYMTIYGTNVFIRFAATRNLLAGSRWELKDPRVGNLATWIYRGVEPLAFRGDSFYRPTGRSVGQSWIQNNGATYILIDSVAQLVQSANPADKAAFEGMIKRWMTEDAFKGALDFTGKSSMALPVVLEIRRIMNDPKIQPRPAPLGPFVFHNTDYVVYHRPAFAASLSLSSSRIATHEMMQDVNKRGWYQGDGALFVHTADPHRYNGDFWPTVNPYRLPGTTVDTQARKDGGSGPENQGKPSSSPWAGGLALGDHALAGMELHAAESSLKARKAWFFFGDQIVCLGAGINVSVDRTIETIVENAKLNAAGDNAFVVNGEARPANIGWSDTLEGTKWAHLAGSADGADIGWFFPQAATLQAVRESRTGKWQDLFTRDKNKGDKTNHFLTFWIDHGKSPKDAGYAYVILPGATRAVTAAYAENPGIEVIRNTYQVQAVRSAVHGITGIHFWEAGEAAGIASNGKAAVLVEDKGGTIRVAVCDPTQLEKAVEISLPFDAVKLKLADERINVLASAKPLKLAVNLEGLHGKSVSATFSR